MIKEICVYGHYGSWNHGNEAIIRGLHEIMGEEKVILYSFNPHTDIEFSLDKICDVRCMRKKINRYSITNIVGYLLNKLFKNNDFRYKREFKPMLKEASNNKLFILEMGDQYCENHLIIGMYRFLNKELHKRGAKVIALGGSVNEGVLNNSWIVDDLKMYDYIIARESLTYDLLKKRQINNISLVPDVAFAMKPQTCTINEDMFIQKTIGIVVGGIAQDNEDKYLHLIDGVNNLIEYILKETKYNILLIPHVNVSEYLNDIETEERIYRKYKDTNRVFIESERKADELKYIISKCHMLVTLRTHASIAAYSSRIPTLVLGYSIKSRGIAKDIFGDIDKYVVDVMKQDFSKKLVSRFIDMSQSIEQINKIYENNMGRYIDDTSQVKEIIQNMR